MAISARALHFVLKIGDRKANINFFRNVLGMKVKTQIDLSSVCLVNGNRRQIVYCHVAEF